MRMGRYGEVGKLPTLWLDICCMICSDHAFIAVIFPWLARSLDNESKIN